MRTVTCSELSVVSGGFDLTHNPFSKPNHPSGNPLVDKALEACNGFPDSTNFSVSSGVNSNVNGELSSPVSALNGQIATNHGTTMSGNCGDLRAAQNTTPPATTPPRP